MLPLGDRLYWTDATLNQVAPATFRINKLTMGRARTEKIQQGKLRITSAKLLLQRMTIFALWALRGTDEESTWGALCALCFSLCARINEVKPTPDISRDDIRFDGDVVHFGTGSRTTDGSRRPVYIKVPILPSDLTEALVDHVFKHQDLLSRSAYLIDKYQRFDIMMQKHGISELVEAISTRFTPRAFRSMGVSLLEHVHDIRGVHANKTTGAFEAARLQLGHGVISRFL